MVTDSLWLTRSLLSADASGRPSVGVRQAMQLKLSTLDLARLACNSSSHSLLTPAHWIPDLGSPPLMQAAPPAPNDGGLCHQLSVPDPGPDTRSPNQLGLNAGCSPCCPCWQA